MLLCKEAKDFLDEGDLDSLQKSLSLYKAALKLNPTNAKLSKKIQKIEVNFQYFLRPHRLYLYKLNQVKFNHSYINYLQNNHSRCI